MKNVTLVAVGAIGVMAGAATAAFTGLKLETWVGDGWLDNGYRDTGLSTIRLWANFDGEGDDGVLAEFGIDGVPLSVNSWNGLFSNSQAGLDSLTAPQDLRFAGIWENQWDTYVTINAESADGDATGLSPGFAEETNSLASNWVTENAGWFVTPDDEQSRAREKPDGGLGVLLAQFSVENQGGPSGDVFFTLNLLLRDGTQLEGLGIPAPGALALLGLAGLAGRRRRE